MPGVKRFGVSFVSCLLSFGCQLLLPAQEDGLIFGFGGNGGGKVPFEYFWGEVSLCSDPWMINRMEFIEITWNQKEAQRALGKNILPWLYELYVPCLLSPFSLVASENELLSTVLSRLIDRLGAGWGAFPFRCTSVSLISFEFVASDDILFTFFHLFVVLAFKKSGNSKLISVPRWSSNWHLWARFNASRRSILENVVE